MLQQDDIVDRLLGGVGGGPFCDCRLPFKLLWGPFATTRDFHEALGEFGVELSGNEFRGMVSTVEFESEMNQCIDIMSEVGAYWRGTVIFL